MKRQHPQQTLLLGLASLLLIFFLYQLGFLTPYAFLFSEKHLHRPNFFFRLGFIAVFALLNHIWFVSHFYRQKRYTFYALIVLFSMIGMLISPDFILPQPKFDPSVLGGKNGLAIHPKMPIPIPLFEMIHTILLLFLSVFASIAFYSNREKIQNTLSDSPIQTLETEKSEKPEAVENAEITNKQAETIKTITETALTVTVNYSLMKIEFADILFIKSMDNYLHFHLKDKRPILVRMTFKEATERLPSSDFLRVHKSYMVAVKAIDSVRNKTIFIKDQEIPMGRAYENAIFQIFGK
jgi:LytTr DNA-binding domain